MAMMSASLYGHGVFVPDILGQPVRQLLCQCLIQMESAEIVPPSIKTGSIALAEGSNSTRSGSKVKQHGRTHRGPPHAWPGPNGFIHIRYAGDTGFHKVQRFPPQCGLEAISNVTGHFSLDANSDLANISIKLLYLLDHTGICELITSQHFHEE